MDDKTINIKFDEIKKDMAMFQVGEENLADSLKTKIDKTDYIDGLRSDVSSLNSGKVDIAQGGVNANKNVVTDASGNVSLESKPTIPVVNDGTLTVKKNGTSVATFSANSLSNVDADISVPTSTSELNNDSGFLSSHQSIKVLNTNNSTTQSANTSENISGNGTIDLHKVSKTGSYNDLLNKPSIPAKDSDLTNDRYVRYDVNSQGLNSTQKSNARANIGAGTSSFSGSYNDLSNKPTLGSASSKDTGTSQGDIPVLGVNGKLATSVIPASAITDTFVVSSQAAMLALSSAEVGDVAVRTDENKSYILKEEPYSTLTNWQELLTPTDAVTSVNSQTGVIVLSASDVGAEPTIVTKNTAFNKNFETSTANIKMDGTVSVGTSNNVARADHIHPSDSTKADLSDVVTDVTYDSTNKKIKKTKNGSSSDVVVFGDNAFTSTTIPTNTSQLTNDSGYVTKSSTNLLYYTKSSDLATVATSGSYSDLTNKPTVPTKLSDLSNDVGYITVYVSALRNYTKTSDLGALALKDSVDYSTEVTNKPTIPTVNDSTITITQGGVTKGSFSLNQSSAGTIALDAGGGSSTDVQVDGSSITSGVVANLKTINSDYNSSSNKLATANDISGKANVGLDNVSPSLTSSSKTINGVSGTKYVGSHIIVESWKSSDGKQWYRKWSDGFKECGIYLPTGNNTEITITLPIKFTVEKSIVGMKTNEWDSTNLWGAAYVDLYTYVNGTNYTTVKTYSSNASPSRYYFCGY